MRGAVSYLKRNAFQLASLFVLATLVFGTASAMDPEPYHDGSQLPAAIGVSQGLRVHADVFSAYGFTTAWLQGLFVYIFGPDLLTIRFLNAALLTLVAVQIYMLGQRLLGTRTSAWGFAVCWILVWPGMAVSWSTPLLPWPSVLFLVFQLFALHMLLQAQSSTEPGRSRAGYFLAGLSLALATLTRLNYGVALLACVCIALLLTYRRTLLKWSEVLLLALGFCTGLLAPLCVVVLQGGFPSFVEQSIVGPLQGKAIVSATPIDYVLAAYVWAAIPLTLCVAVAWLAARVHRAQPRLAYLLLGIAIIANLGWSSIALIDFPTRNFLLSRVSWTFAADIQAMQPFYFFAVATLLFGFILGFLSLINRFRNSAKTESLHQKDSRAVLVGLVALASLVQIYPIADPNHLWWAIPIPGLFVLFLLRLFTTVRGFRFIVLTLFIPPVLLSAGTAWAYYSQDRSHVQSGVLSGMYVKAEYQSSVVEIDEFLSLLEPKSTMFNCHEGLFAVWSGEYLASSAAYVDYAYGVTPPTETDGNTFIVDCIGVDDTAYRETLTSWRGKPVLAQTGPVALSYFSSGKLVLTSARAK